MPDEHYASTASRLIGAAFALLSAGSLAILAFAASGGDAAAQGGMLARLGAFLVGSFGWASAYIPLWPSFQAGDRTP